MATPSEWEFFTSNLRPEGEGWDEGKRETWNTNEMNSQETTYLRHKNRINAASSKAREIVMPT